MVPEGGEALGYKTTVVGEHVIDRPCGLSSDCHGLASEKTGEKHTHRTCGSRAYLSCVDRIVGSGGHSGKQLLTG